MSRWQEPRALCQRIKQKVSLFPRGSRTTAFLSSHHSLSPTPGNSAGAEFLCPKSLIILPVSRIILLLLFKIKLMKLFLFLFSLSETVGPSLCPPPIFFKLEFSLTSILFFSCPSLLWGLLSWNWNLIFSLKNGKSLHTLNLS